MDTTTLEVLSRMDAPNIRLISLDEFEKDDAPLRAAKKNRSLIEYYFTCTPSLPLYILNGRPEVSMISYLDADIFFFAPFQPLYEEMGSSSILIVGHRFLTDLKRHERGGIYNVGLLAFRRDEPAIRCLHWWRARCLEWCYDRVENDRFADQKYLNDWPTRFSGVAILQHKGGGLAPWNIANYRLTLNDGHVMVDEQPLIFFHFSGLRRLARWVYTSGSAMLSRVARRHIYIPYIHELQKSTRHISSISNDISGIQGQSIRYRGVSRKGVLRWLASRARSPLRSIKGLTRLIFYAIKGSTRLIFLIGKRRG